MDYPHESYVRLYVRDSKTWLRLGWEGQALLCLLLRKLDRAGELDGLEDPIDDLSLITGMPSAIVTVGLERLLARGVLTLEGGRLCMPNFVWAQTCPKSDRLRQRESRERRLVSERMSQSVSQASQESAAVTNVTLSLAQPSLAKPNRREDEKLNSASPAQPKAPTPKPTDADCGALAPRHCADETSYVSRPVWHTLRGWEEPPGWDLELAAAGVSRTVFNKRFAELLIKPIGGRSGVDDRTAYLRNQLPKWRTWEEQANAQATARAVKAELQGGGTWSPSPLLRRFALGKCKLSESDFERLAQVYAYSEDWYGRIRADADKRFAARVAEAARARDLTRKVLSGEAPSDD